jgi:biopolymer transport protein ExbB
MAEFGNALERLRDFLNLGGPILLVLILVIALMWVLIFERLTYLWTEHRCRAHDELAEFAARPDPESWHSARIYEALMSRLRMRLEHKVPLIKALAKVCPLLGLLGTVTGMIWIFTVMGLVGNTAPRAIAGGVSTAIITTMAGMVGALSGLFPATYLARTMQMSMQSIRNDPMRIARTPVEGIRRASPVVRIGVSLVAGCMVCLALVNMMEAMARFTGEVVVRESVKFKADYVRVERERRVERRQHKPDRPERPEDQPDVEEVSPELADMPDGGALVIQAPRATLNASLGLDSSVRLGGFIADGDYLPIVKVEPVFPRAAVTRRLEGWVLVSFTVTATGSVKDVMVLESSNEIFHQAAMQAAEKFRYKPRVSNGEPIEVHGVRNRIWFLFDPDSSMRTEEDV